MKAVHFPSSPFPGLTFRRLRLRLQLAAGLLALAPAAHAQVLFDATKAEMAGNADWVIDADTHNLGVSSASDGSGTRGGGSDSNPQRVPAPAAAGITASTAETYWNGALSAWAVALVQRGQRVVETLPVFTTPTGGATRSRITYGDASNPQDLARYRLYVVCEPNIRFTAAEKTAILSFVRNGGGLFMVSDHDGSDRNNDGDDSVAVWNDFLTNNDTGVNPFGFSFNATSVTPTSESVDTANAADPLTHGPAGAVTHFAYDQGATLTILNANVARAAVWQTSTRAGNAVLALYGTYGAGRFAAIGDSSPCDDGTGDPGDMLYDGWDGANGDNARLILNASQWLLAAAPRILSVARTGTNGVDVTLTYATELGRSYRVERLATLPAGSGTASWTPLGTAAVAGTGQPGTFTDAGGGAAGTGQEFYRVRVTTP